VKVLLLSARNESVGIDVPLPVGPACAAAATERAGHAVRLLSNVAGGEVSAIADAVLQIRTDVIGISARNIDDQNMQAPTLLLALLWGVVAASVRYLSILPCQRCSASSLLLAPRQPVPQ
jgi:hypothetical protein